MESKRRFTAYIGVVIRAIVLLLLVLAIGFFVFRLVRNNHDTKRAKEAAKTRRASDGTRESSSDSADTETKLKTLPSGIAESDSDEKSPEKNSSEMGRSQGSSPNVPGAGMGAEPVMMATFFALVTYVLLRVRQKSSIAQ